MHPGSRAHVFPGSCKELFYVRFGIGRSSASRAFGSVGRARTTRKDCLRSDRHTGEWSSSPIRATAGGSCNVFRLLTIYHATGAARPIPGVSARAGSSQKANLGRLEGGSSSVCAASLEPHESMRRMSMEKP